MSHSLGVLCLQDQPDKCKCFLQQFGTSCVKYVTIIFLHFNFLEIVQINLLRDLTNWIYAHFLHLNVLHPCMCPQRNGDRMRNAKILNLLNRLNWRIHIYIYLQIIKEHLWHLNMMKTKKIILLHSSPPPHSLSDGEYNIFSYTCVDTSDERDWDLAIETGSRLSES